MSYDNQRFERNHLTTTTISFSFYLKKIENTPILHKRQRIPRVCDGSILHSLHWKIHGISSSYRLAKVMILK
jgi:hypothetical protein